MGFCQQRAGGLLLGISPVIAVALRFSPLSGGGWGQFPPEIGVPTGGVLVILILVKLASQCVTIRWRTTVRGVVRRQSPRREVRPNLPTEPAR